MSKNGSLEETEPSFDQKRGCSNKPGKNAWNKEKDSSKTGQEYKTFISFFEKIFSCNWKGG